MTQTVLRCMGIAGAFECRNIGEWVRSCDFEARGGRGQVTFTKDPNQALRFASNEEALRYIRTASKTVPLRPDGRPNRILTAYHLLVEPAPTAPQTRLFPDRPRRTAQDRPRRA